MTSSDPRAEAPVAERRWTDHQVDLVIGRLLQLGVLIAAIVVGGGGLLLLARSGHVVPDFRQFRGQPAMLSSLTGIVRGVVAHDARAIVQLGLVLLIATPVARVALTLFAFIVQRDRLYVAMTALVLALLLYGLLYGRA